MLYPFSLPPMCDQTNGQMDGTECVWCPGVTDGEMIPVGRLYDTQVFGHKECAEAHRI